MLYDPMECSPPGSSVHGILWARILQWVTISFSRGSSLTSDPHCRQVLYHLSTREVHNVCMCVCVCVCVYVYIYMYIHICIHTSMRAKSLQLCSTLCDPMDCSLPGSSVHGLLQAGMLEWVAMPSYRGTFQPRDRIHVFCSYCIAGGFFTAKPPGKCMCVCVLLFFPV